MRTCRTSDVLFMSDSCVDSVDPGIVPQGEDPLLDGNLGDL